MDFLMGKLLEESYPEVRKKNCIHINKNSQGCSKCADICPQKAIKLEAKKVCFDEKLCNRCGVCKAICPTQAIILKGLGEENILRTIKDKDNIIFSCSKMGGAGTLKLSCLNAFHTELLAALFILYGDKTFYFNTSKCENCKEVSNNYSLLLSSLKKAEDFVKLIGIEPNYEIITIEDDLNNLLNTTISRRDLLTYIKKESGNLAIQTVYAVVSDKNDYLSLRKVLLKAIEEKENLEKKAAVYAVPFLGSWNVSNSCNGCGVCQSICPEGAWKIEKGEKKLGVSHNAGKCYKCGMCVSLCPQKAIIDGNVLLGDISIFSLKSEMDLITCPSCNKKFVPINKDKKQCSICEKREALRNKIACYLDEVRR